MKIASRFISGHRRSSRVALVFYFLIFAAYNSAHAATITPYSVELAWQLAAAPTVLENFESYAGGTQIPTLPALGVGFDVLAGTGYPATYFHIGPPNTTHGAMHLGNFPNGVGGTPSNQFNDIVMQVLVGYTITAVGFWNGDGQLAAILEARVYDTTNAFIGSVSALSGTFAGFVADAPISRVEFEGITGDGWNHLDGLQTNVRAVAQVPEPSTILLLGSALTAYLKTAYLRRRRG
jgi:hypothetical protein